MDVVIKKIRVKITANVLDIRSHLDVNVEYFIVVKLVKNVNDLILMLIIK